MYFSENNLTSVLIGTPMYGGMCTYAYTSSLINSIMDLRKNDIGAYWYFVANESLITRGRNYLVDYFLTQTNCTHLMFIDADITYPETSIRRLIEADKEIICAPYPKKFIDWENIAKVAASKSEPIPNIHEYGASYVINYIDSSNIPLPDKNGVIEILHGGTGFMCIKREVFLKMKPQLKKARAANFGRFDNWYTEYFMTEIDEDGVFQSEDWYFCNRWRNLGGKIHLIPNIKLDHMGSHIYSGNILKAGANIT